MSDSQQPFDGQEALGQLPLFDDRVQPWVHADGAVSAEAQRERQALLAALADSEYGTVEQKVACILQRYPEARDSHTRLAIKYWSIFDAERLAEWDRLSLDVLLDLENFENIERAARNIQNTLKLWSGTDRFRTMRDSKQQFFYQYFAEQRSGDPEIRIYLDETGTDNQSRYLAVAGVCAADWRQYERYHAALCQWREALGFPETLHAADVRDDNSLQLALLNELRKNMVGATLLILCLTATNAAADTPRKDLVDTAVAAGPFKTLVATLKAAGLVDTLKGAGPFTVFAPTDAAFAKLPKGTLESLLKPENKQKLAGILTLHVVPGRLAAADVSGKTHATTVQGTDVLFATASEGVKVDLARVVKADVPATNGLIHVIDRVLLPKDVVETAAVAGQFKTLLAAAKAAGLVEALKAPDATLTVFAPTDEAFRALPPGTVEDLLRSANRQRLAAILKHHVLPRRLVLTSQSLTTLQGDNVQVRAAGSARVEEAKVLLADIKATNGVIHVIDQVLLPDLPEPTPARKAMALIELAVERGVALFNSHKVEACAAIYEVTAQSLLTGHTDALDETARKRLREALAAVRKDHSPRKKAWVLRYALDDVYRSLRK